MSLQILMMRFWRHLNKVNQNQLVYWLSQEWTCSILEMFRYRRTRDLQMGLGLLMELLDEQGILEVQTSLCGLKLITVGVCWPLNPLPLRLLQVLPNKHGLPHLTMI